MSGNLLYRGLGREKICAMRTDQMPYYYVFGVLRLFIILTPCVQNMIIEGITDESATATYVERSLAPLNPQGWTTFRRIGCFTREEREPQSQNHPHLQVSSDGSEHVVLRYSDRTPDGCAAHCSVKTDGGVGFFGIGSGDE